ncbi:MAG: hypothetical protein WD342_02935 [Verrucomicrobiales bacterium]
MRLRLITIFLLTGIVFANEPGEVWTQSFQFDGFLPKISESHQFDVGEPDEFGLVDLKKYFETFGLDIPTGSYIHYNTRSGNLIGRGNQEMFDLVESVISSLLHHESEIEFATAIVATLKPMSANDRVTMVLKTGYRPDTLIQSYVDRIREIQRPLDEVDYLSKIPPFPGDEKKKPKLTEKEITKRKEQVTLMKATLAELLSTSLEAVETELKTLNAAKAEQDEALKP